MYVRRFLSVFSILALTVAVIASADVTAQQWTPEKRGSDNIEVISHIPLGSKLSVSNIEISQEMDRPYAFVGRMVYGHEGEKGIDIVDLSDERRPEVIYRWRIENQDLHLGLGGMDVKYFKWADRWYVVQSLQFGQGGPDSDMGAVVLDIIGLPDPDAVREVVKIRIFKDPETIHPMNHPVHIHGQRFLVTEIDGVSNPNLVWKDTAIVAVGSTVDFLVEITNPGDWVMHCHIAEHLHAGMMLSFHVDE